MKKTNSLTEIFELTKSWQNTGHRIALVPTMGCLHAGHLALAKLARKKGDKVVLTIFVNPTQFGPNEDFNAYPRQLEVDCSLAENEGVDVVFCPSPDDMYSESFQTTIHVEKLSQGLCGQDRPGHFDGVALVLTKLFHLTNPNIAIFGEKDFQQLTIIRRLVADLNFKIEILGHPIVREADGLAMSSRNKYLSKEGRRKSLALYKAICEAKKLVASTKETVSAKQVISNTQNILEENGVEIEYIVVIDEENLQPHTSVGKTSILALAAKIDGAVRLIDNSNLLKNI